MYKKINFLNLIKYSIVGILNIALYFFILKFLITQTDLKMELSTALALLSSVFFQFYCNKKFTFKTQKIILSECLRYLTWVGCNYILSNFLLKEFISLFNMSINFSLVITMLILTVVGFLVSNFWVFKKG